jgi:hypothetical protein
MKLSICLLFALATLSYARTSFAQREAPVWHSFLPRISMFNERTTLDFEVTFMKGGGPHEQSAHSQMYVFGYLEKDEPQILQLAADKTLTTKSKDEKRLLLDVLVDEKLITRLETKVAKESELPAVTSSKSTRTLRGGNCYDFEFSFNNKSLFETIGKLKNFDQANFVDSDQRYYNDKFKLLIFVPVNDCKYATEIPEVQRELYDFAHFMDRETIIQYFKPLPYRFQFKPLDEEGVVLLYID